MGLLDQVLGGLMGGQGGDAPLQGVLMNMLGGNQQQGGAQQSGLGSLLGAFEQAGLGHIAQSWISNGPNQPVSPQQLQGVLGDSQVQDLSSKAGMPPQDFLARLSQHLPNAVDGMTPNGQVPDEGTQWV